MTKLIGKSLKVIGLNITLVKYYIEISWSDRTFTDRLIYHKEIVSEKIVLDKYNGDKQ